MTTPSQPTPAAAEGEAALVERVAGAIEYDLFLQEAKNHDACAECGHVRRFVTVDEVTEDYLAHVTGDVDLRSLASAAIIAGASWQREQSAAAEGESELVEAARYARTAIDTHLGDTDLPNGNDDPLFIAHQKLSAALAGASWQREQSAPSACYECGSALVGPLCPKCSGDALSPIIAEAIGELRKPAPSLPQLRAILTKGGDAVETSDPEGHPLSHVAQAPVAQAGAALSPSAGDTVAVPREWLTQIRNALRHPLRWSRTGADVAAEISRLLNEGREP